MNDLLPEMELNMFNVWKCFRATFDTCYLQTFQMNDKQIVDEFVNYFWKVCHGDFLIVRTEK